MKRHHLLIVFITIFVWIFSLPLLAVMTFLFAPILLPFAIVSFLLSIYVINLEPCTHSFLRDFITGFQLFNWFPCNTIQLKQQRVVSVHPHGLLSCGALAGVHFVKGSETIFCVAPILYFVPLLGHSLNLLGCIPATRKSMKNVLSNGYSLIVVSGGVPELVLSETNDDLEWYPRFGFLKLASANSVHVLSVFVNGETSLYNVIQLPCLRNRVKLSWFFNIPLMFPLISGFYGTWMPKRTRLVLRKYLHMQNTTRLEYTKQLMVSSTTGL
jgi:hypothetical protein